MLPKQHGSGIDGRSHMYSGTNSHKNSPFPYDNLLSVALGEMIMDLSVSSEILLIRSEPPIMKHTRCTKGCLYLFRWSRWWERRWNIDPIILLDPLPSSLLIAWSLDP